MMVLHTSWHERSVLCTRNWRMHLPWPIHRILQSAHVHSKFFEAISTGVIEKQASPITSGTTAPCHTYQNFSVTASTWLTCENRFSGLATVSCFHGYIFWLSWFARKKLICWSDLQAMPFCICKEEDSVMPVLEPHQLRLAEQHRQLSPYHSRSQRWHPSNDAQWGHHNHQWCCARLSLERSLNKFQHQHCCL